MIRSTRNEIESAFGRLKDGAKTIKSTKSNIFQFRISRFVRARENNRQNR